MKNKVDEAARSRKFTFFLFVCLFLFLVVVGEGGGVLNFLLFCSAEMVLAMGA